MVTRNIPHADSGFIFNKNLLRYLIACGCWVTFSRSPSKLVERFRSTKEPLHQAYHLTYSFHPIQSPIDDYCPRNLCENHCLRRPATQSPLSRGRIDQEWHPSRPPQTTINQRSRRGLSDSPLQPQRADRKRHDFPASARLYLT